LLEERSQSLENATYQRFKIIILSQNIIQRATGSRWKVCFALVTPDFGSSILFEYLGKLNFITAYDIAVRLTEG
jgi:hypothetical protein